MKLTPANAVDFTSSTFLLLLRIMAHRSFQEELLHGEHAKKTFKDGWAGYANGLSDLPGLDTELKKASSDHAELKDRKQAICSNC